MNQLMSLMMMDNNNNTLKQLTAMNLEGWSHKSTNPFVVSEMMDNKLPAMNLQVLKLRFNTGCQKPMYMLKSPVKRNNHNTQQKLTAMNMYDYNKPKNNFNAKAEKQRQNKKHKKQYATGTKRFRYNSQRRSLRW